MRRTWMLASMLAVACGSSPSPAPADATAQEGGAQDAGTQEGPLPPDAAASVGPDVPPIPGTEPAEATAVFQPGTRGTGACATRTLAEVIGEVRRQRPDLADIVVLHGMDANLGGDGNRIFAFLIREGGFRLIFKRGDSDCPSGCIDNWYWYFQTDAACAPVLQGQYARVFVSPGNCFKVEGTPLWGVPPAIDPAHVCGADNRPQDINGTYDLQGTGSRLECTSKASAEPSVQVSLALRVTVIQNAADLASGTATVVGTGNPRIDGQPLPATFTRRRLTARREFTAVSMCLDQHDTTLELDLEGPPRGSLQFTEARALGCPPSQDYCKGQLSLQLGR